MPESRVRSRALLNCSLIRIHFQAEQLYALGIWTRFASRWDRLRMRISPMLEDDIVANAVLANPQLAAWSESGRAIGL